MKDKKAAIGFTYEDSTPGDKNEKDDDADDDSDEESEEDVETVDLGMYMVGYVKQLYGIGENSCKFYH